MYCFNSLSNVSATASATELAISFLRESSSCSPWEEINPPNHHPNKLVIKALLRGDSKLLRLAILSPTKPTATIKPINVCK